MAKILRNPFEKDTSALSTGSLFEMEVLAYLSKQLASKYVVIPNVILDNSSDTSDASGALTRREVDHLIVGPNGLFLLEAKKYHGPIDGFLWGYWDITQTDRLETPLPYREKSKRKEAVALQERIFRVTAILEKFINKTRQRSLEPYKKVRGIFVFPEHASLNFFAKDGKPVHPYADVRAVSLDKLVASIESDPPPRFATPLSKQDVLMLSELMDKGIVPGTSRAGTERTIGHYRLEDEIDRDQAPNGINFIVYRVKDLHTGVDHRGKYYDWSPMDKRAQAIWTEQIQRHKKALAALSADRRIHRIITAMEDVESFGYLVVESLINHPTLSELLNNTQNLKKVNLNQLMLNLALGLRSVHRSRFVHRELSPKSVFVDVDESDVVITNFELAKMLGESVGATSQVIPTVFTRSVPTNSYRAPEIASSPHDVDERADVYSWGAVYFRLISGRQFRNDAKSFEYLAGLPGLKDSLRQLIEKCLEADPVDRPRNIEEVVSALRDI
jgi:serine/threonine protein kinase